MASGKQLTPRPTVDPEDVVAQQEKAKQRVLDSKDLLSGLWLPKVASENADNCSQLCGRPLGPGPSPRTLQWASCCSGTEGIAFVMHTLAQLYQEKQIPCEFSHAFSCEIAEEKRRWISHVTRCAGPVIEQMFNLESEVKPLAADDVDLPCIFGNILDLAGETAHCYQHDGFCRVPSVDLLVIGTSCKDMSRANPNPGERSQTVLDKTTSKGSSAQTFQGLLHYLDTQRPYMILFENVDAMDDAKSGGQSNNDIFQREMSNRGYEWQSVMVDSHQFGLPCHRRRLYYFLIRATGNPLISLEDRSLKQVFATFRALLSGCLRGNMCATTALLEPDDPAVLMELQARQDKMKSAAGKKKTNASHTSVAETSATSGGGQSWTERHMQFAENNKLRWGQQPPAILQRNPWFQTLTDREKDLLPLCQAVMEGCLFRDLSQSIARVNFQSWDKETGTHTTQTILPKSVCWIGSDENSRVMLGREALTFQGFPAIPFLQKLEEHAEEFKLSTWRPSESLMQDLAGNAMSLPVLLAMLQSAFAAISWSKTGSESSAPSKDKAARPFMTLYEPIQPIQYGLF